jgi:hypothetical protein
MIDLLGLMVISHSLYFLAFLYNIGLNLTSCEQFIVICWLSGMLLTMGMGFRDQVVELKSTYGRWMQMKQHTRDLEARRIARGKSTNCS